MVILTNTQKNIQKKPVTGTSSSIYRQEIDSKLQEKGQTQSENEGERKGNWTQKFGNIGNIYENAGEYMSNIQYPNIPYHNIHTPEFFPKKDLLPEKVDLTIKMNEDNFRKMVRGIQVIGGQDIDDRNEITSFKVSGCSLPGKENNRCNKNYTSFLIDFYSWDYKNIYSLRMNGWRCGIVLEMKDRQVKIEIEYEEPPDNQQIKIDNNNINLTNYIDNVPTDPEQFVKFMFNDVISKEYNKKYAKNILKLKEQVNDMSIITQMTNLDRLFNNVNNKIKIEGKINPIVPTIQLSQVNQSQVSQSQRIQSQVNQSQVSQSQVNQSQVSQSQGSFCTTVDKNSNTIISKNDNTSSRYLPSKKTVSNLTKPFRKKTQQQIQTQKQINDNNIFIAYNNIKNIEEKQINQNYFDKILGLIEHSKIENFLKENIDSLSFCKLAPSRVGSITNLLQVNDDYNLYKINKAPFFMRNIPNNTKIKFILNNEVSDSVSAQNI